MVTNLVINPHVIPAKELKKITKFLIPQNFLSQNHSPFPRSSPVLNQMINQK